jgi:hypothetical protein
MAGSAMDEFIPFVMQMLNNAPDANAPTPLVNRQATVYGVTIPFLVGYFLNHVSFVELT